MDHGMTKAELVKEVAQAADLSKKHSEVVVNVVFQSIIAALQQDEKVELRGFGSFRIRQRRSRQGRNPKTGDKVQVPPKKIPYFKPGKELKQFINDALIPGIDVPAPMRGDVPASRRSESARTEGAARSGEARGDGPR